MSSLLVDAFRIVDYVPTARTFFLIRHHYSKKFQSRQKVLLQLYIVSVTHFLVGNLLLYMFFAKICCKFLAFFSFFAEKTLKMTISTSVWSAQHPNAGRNIQQLLLRMKSSLLEVVNMRCF